jgi:hypothetical protein
MCFCLQGGGLFSSGRDFLGSGSLLADGHPIRFYIIHGFHVTETDALRVPVTEIALKNLPINDIEVHGAEGTNRYTGAAANAFVLVDHDPAELLVPGNGLHGTDNHAGSILALLTGHGNIEPFLFPFDHLNTASRSIGDTVVENRADKLAKPAPGALFKIDLKYFTHGFHSHSPFTKVQSKACGYNDPHTM